MNYQFIFWPVIRDVLIITALTFIGGFIAGLAAPPNSHTLLFGIVASNLLLGTLGFIISGCLTPHNRWRHLVCVAIGAWLVGIINVLYFGFSVGFWIGGIIVIAAMMGIGGALSFAFRREDKPIPKDDNAFYDEVARELQEKSMIAGLWTKAYAEMEGDDAKARALYIKYRVAQLAEAKASQSPKPDKQTVSSRTRKHNLVVLAFIIIVIVCLVCIVKHYTSTTSSNPASYDADAAKDFRANGFKSLVLGMKLQDVTLDYTVTSDDQFAGLKTITFNKDGNGNFLSIGSYPLTSISADIFHDELYSIHLKYADNQKEIYQVFKHRFGPLVDSDLPSEHIKSKFLLGDTSRSIMSAKPFRFEATIEGPEAADETGTGWNTIELSDFYGYLNANAASQTEEKTKR